MYCRIFPEGYETLSPGAGSLRTIKSPDLRFVKGPTFIESLKVAETKTKTKGPP